MIILGSETFIKKFKPQIEKLTSIDEDEVQTEIDISDGGFNYDSIKRWKINAKTGGTNAYEPVVDKNPPFQSESTLVGADSLHKEEKYSFKSRIAHLLYKPKEKVVKVDEKKKAILLKKEEVRDKSPSFLMKIGMLGTKFGQLNPFQNDASVGKKSGSTEFKPFSENSSSEQRYIQKSKKSFESKYTVHFYLSTLIF